MNRGDLVYAIACLVCAVIVVLLMTGCGALRLDNTASGGGSWSVETYHPCVPPEGKPIGGNTGEVGNTTTRGGTAGTRKP